MTNNLNEELREITNQIDLLTSEIKEQINFENKLRCNHYFVPKYDFVADSNRKSKIICIHCGLTNEKIVNRNYDNVSWDEIKLIKQLFEKSNIDPYCVSLFRNDNPFIHENYIYSDKDFQYIKSLYDTYKDSFPESTDSQIEEMIELRYQMAGKKYK